MADNKNNQTHTDAQKASGVTPDTSLAPINTTKKKVYKAPKAKKERKKGLPIAVDIFIVLALLAIIAGGYFGIRAIANYFAVSYEQREISYTLLISDAAAELVFDADGECVIQSDCDAFVVTEEQDELVGQVHTVSTEQQEDGTVDVYIEVYTTADYRHGLGYFVNRIKIAVGKEYTCRCSGLYASATIVELQITE